MSHIQITDNDIKDKKNSYLKYLYIDKKVLEFYPELICVATVK